jgi:2-polyprenyl-6-methoxyphenol hydroxylase-like FAD-dependent oxidoreductase
MDQHSILIIGGGIGGLATTIALLNLGYKVELIEREIEWTALGAGLTFNGATARAFRTIGVLDEVLSAGFSHGTSSICDKDGRVMVESSNEEVYGPGIPPMGGILRPVLHDIMKHRALSLGLNVRTGVTAQSLELNENRTDVIFSDGSVGRYDLVIGADGLRSQTRQQIFPDAPRPTFTGQGSWRAVGPRPSEVKTSALYFGTEFKAGINPVSQEEMYLFLLVAEPNNPWIDPADWPRTLRAKLAGFGGHIAALRETLGPDSRIVYRPLETLVLPGPWFRQRVLLIGDAAHATTPHVGYGAGLAVEDAIVLAELLGEGLPLDAALRAFMQRRYQRCAKIVSGSVKLGQLEIDQAPVAQQRALSRELFSLIQEPA